MNYIDTLKSMDACEPAIDWLIANQFETLQAAWDACPRGTWMLWLLGRTTDRRNDNELRLLTLAKARCAKLVLHLMTDERSRNAVAVAEKFGTGEASRDELDAAADAAYAVSNTAATATHAPYADDAAAAAYYASLAATYAADAYAITYAAYAAAYPADAAAYAAATGCNAARHEMLSKCADAIRGMIPVAPIL